MNEGHQGGNLISFGNYSKYCFWWTEDCVLCNPGPDLVSDNGAEVEELISAIRTLPAAQLAGFVEVYAHRLLLSPTRNLVVIQGNRCDPLALASVLFVSPETSRVLQTHGLRLLDDFLKESAQGES
jgi:hypothetical protein